MDLFLLVMVLLAMGFSLLLAGLFGNLRPFFSVVAGLAAIFAAGLVVVRVGYWLTADKGWGEPTASILLIILLAFGVAAGAAHLAYSQYSARKKQKPRLPRRLRILLFAVGFSCVAGGVVVIEWQDIGLWVSHSAVKIGSERALVWSLKTWKRNREVILDALHQREPGPDTLRLLSKSLPYIKDSEGSCGNWCWDAWEVLLRQPRGPERLEVAAQFFHLYGVSEYDVLNLSEQNERDILSAIARTPAVGEILCHLVSKGRDHKARLLFQLAREAETADGRKNSSLANLPCAGALKASPNTPPTS